MKVLRMVGAGSGDSDALDFIIFPGYEQICAQTFLTWLRQACTCGTCALETLPQHSLIAHQIRALAGKNDLKLYCETSANFFIDLPSTWAEYLDALEPGFRPLLTRYPKRLHSRFNVSIIRCERKEDLDPSLKALFALHQLRWTGRGEPGAFSSTGRRDFYRRIARAFHNRGWLEFWLLKIADEIAAAQFCFRYRDTVYLLQEGFHPRYTAEKIGYALRAHMLQEMIRNGATRYDFLGGADAYKLKFGARRGSYLTLRLAGTRRGRWALAGRHHKQQIKQWLKRMLPAFLLAAVGHERDQTAIPRHNESME